jgi:methyl-accepting chemotaxis protein
MTCWFPISSSTGSAQVVVGGCMAKPRRRQPRRSGVGFGVVAAEVRLLAQRTGTAAKAIRVLIADSGSKVEIGTHEVNQSGATLVEIVHSVKRVTDMVAEIAAASREQSTGVEQVNTAVIQVDQVTQLNTTPRRPRSSRPRRAACPPRPRACVS